MSGAKADSKASAVAAATATAADAKAEKSADAKDAKDEKKKVVDREPVLPKQPLPRKFQAFVDWCKANGAVFPKLALVQYAEDYRGVETTEPVATNERILYVPDALILTAKKAEESAIGKAIAKAKLDVHAGHLLSMYLLQENAKKEASFWAPWLAVHPTAFRNLPMFWSRAEVDQLKGSVAVARIEAKRKDLKEEWAQVNGLDECKNFSWKQFCWARGSVMSRTFGVVIGDRDDESALVPFADMMNHKLPSGTKWTYDESVNGFTLNSWGGLGAGATLHESYGKKSNLRFLMSYGFCMVENKFDEVALAPLLTLRADDDALEDRAWEISHKRVPEQLNAAAAAGKPTDLAAAMAIALAAVDAARSEAAGATAAAAAAAAADSKAAPAPAAQVTAKEAAAQATEDDTTFPLRSKVFDDLKDEEHQIGTRYRKDEGTGKVLCYLRLLHARNEEVRTAALALAELEAEAKAEREKSDADKEKEAAEKEKAKAQEKEEAKKALELQQKQKEVAAADAKTHASGLPASPASEPKKPKLPPPPFAPIRAAVTSDGAAAKREASLRPSAVLIESVLQSRYQDETPALSIRNELAALRAFERALLRTLAGYPNSEADDQLIWAKHEQLQASLSAAATAAVVNQSPLPPSAAAAASSAASSSSAATAAGSSSSSSSSASVAAVPTINVAVYGQPSAAAIAQVTAMKEPLTWNLRNAVLVRMGEKSIIRRTLPFVREAIALYSLPYMHLKAHKIEAVNAKTPTALQRYAMEVALPLVKKQLNLTSAD